MAAATREDLDKYVSKINFHWNKTKLLKDAAQMIVDKFSGKVPNNIKNLDYLPGVLERPPMLYSVVLFINLKE